MVKLYFSAALQVFFVTVTTACIARGLYLGALVASFCINWLWTGNVKRVAFGGAKDRVAYALGGCTGTGAGMFLVYLFDLLK